MENAAPAMTTAKAGTFPWVGSLFFGGIVAVWFGVFHILSAEWEANPQYGYGWFVPLLGGAIFWNRWRTRPEPRTLSPHVQAGTNVLLATLLAALAVATLVGAANAEWRFVMWCLALLAAGVTSVLVAQAGGWPTLAHMSFGIFFLLVCVPWPSKPETWLIQGLTGVAAQVTTFVLQSAGVAAVCRGNVIELEVGILGVDEACSGIRSFQSSLLASLFLGEFYAMRTGWRIVIVLTGLAVAYGLNLARMLVLSFAASSRGIDAVASWHDPAGTWIQLATFALLWTACAGVAKATSAVQALDLPQTVPFFARLPRSAVGAAAATAAAAVLYQSGTEAWYRWHEGRMVKMPGWSVAASPPGADVQDEPFSEEIRLILRHDEGFSRSWQDDAGRTWSLIYLRWQPSKVAVHRARNHTPEICQRGLGRELIGVSEEKNVEVHGIPLSYRIYSFRADGRPLQVFYFFTDDRLAGQSVFTQSLTPDARLRPVLQGRRNTGQRSMQLVVTGIEDPAQAEREVLGKLPEVVVRED